MKTLILFMSVLVLSQLASGATRSSRAIVGKVRGFGARTVLVEMSSGRMVTVPRSALGRKLKMGGTVSWSRS
ncbi:MAG: hypothetical protein K2X47_05000 [Bdellovibrionales bacterium]|nr:hypothetical protein [Bdellovibrionales bacterium]